MKARYRTFAAILFAAALGSAATITSFTATADNSTGTPFTTDNISSTFDGSTANITNSLVTCERLVALAPGACSSNAANFEIIGTGLTATTPVTVSIDGTYSRLSLGTTSDDDLLLGTVTFEFKGFPATRQTYQFNASPSASPFSETLASTSLPAVPGGNFDIVGTFSLSMPNFSQLSLPSSLSVAIGAPTTPGVPEPASVLLLAAGLGVISLAKWKKRRA
jgi:hypothetical protein